MPLQDCLRYGSSGLCKHVCRCAFVLKRCQAAHARTQWILTVCGCSLLTPRPPFAFYSCTQDGQALSWLMAKHCARLSDAFHHCCLSMGTLWMIMGWLRECLRYYGDTDEAYVRASERLRASERQSGASDRAMFMLSCLCRRARRLRKTRVLTT